MGSRDFFVLICALKALKIEILFIFFVVDNEIMTTFIILFRNCIDRR